MSASHLHTGTLGESIAVNFLTKLGYLVLEQNFRSRIGEIDIIANRDETLVFIEVKCRVGDRYGKPYESVSKHKLHRLSKTIHLYLLQNKIQNRKLALEIISIILNPDRSLKSIDHFDHGFDA